MVKDIDHLLYQIEVLLFSIAKFLHYAFKNREKVSKDDFFTRSDLSNVYLSRLFNSIIEELKTIIYISESLKGGERDKEHLQPNEYQNKLQTALVNASRHPAPAHIAWKHLVLMHTRDNNERRETARYDALNNQREYNSDNVKRFYIHDKKSCAVIQARGDRQVPFSLLSSRSPRMRLDHSPRIS